MIAACKSNGAWMMVHISRCTHLHSLLYSMDDGASELMTTGLTCDCSANDTITIGRSNGG
jgi:hypothetical protein